MQRPLEDLNEKMLWNSIKESPRLACFLGDLSAKNCLVQNEPLDIAEADILFKSKEIPQNFSQSGASPDNANPVECQANEEPPSIAPPPEVTSPSIALPIKDGSLAQKAPALRHEQVAKLDMVISSPTAPKIATLDETVIAASITFDEKNLPLETEATQQPHLLTPDVNIRPPTPASMQHRESVTRVATNARESNIPSVATPEVVKTSEPVRLSMEAMQSEGPPAPSTHIEEIAGDKTIPEVPPTHAGNAPSTSSLAAKQTSPATRHGFSNESSHPPKTNLAWGIAALTAFLILLVSIMMTWSTISQNLDFSTLDFKSNPPETRSPAMTANTLGVTPSNQGVTNLPSSSPQPSQEILTPEVATTPPLNNNPPEKHGMDNRNQESPHDPPRR